MEKKFCDKSSNFDKDRGQTSFQPNAKHITIECCSYLQPEIENENVNLDTNVLRCCRMNYYNEMMGY